ncbi:hypothetical protein C1645_808897 [Glomus cerebriforme]|uniref:Uncharacterized protein n=1 Tax=Glomus cerebriforme TaxID=658196 RepID=A0A397SHR7_9GLOM|nr:hypothetical protein C1645_808897 [Glomus cerebriforme]
MSTYITGDNNDFNVKMLPHDVKVKDLSDRNRKEFTITIIGHIELKGMVCLVPPTVEMNVTAFGKDLGRIEGDLDPGVLLNVDVAYINGYIKLYLQSGMFVRLEYDLKAFENQVKKDNVIVLTF